ncbi:MAG: hypothetical protein WCL08_09925, partial [Verrucomicrobiota bacterium]
AIGNLIPAPSKQTIVLAAFSFLCITWLLAFVIISLFYFLGESLNVLCSMAIDLKRISNKREAI